MNQPELISSANRMRVTVSMFAWIEGITIAFLLGYLFGKKTKRRNRKASQKIKCEGSKTNKPLQIEVSVENNINKEI